MCKYLDVRGLPRPLGFPRHHTWHSSHMEIEARHSTHTSGIPHIPIEINHTTVILMNAVARELH